MRRTLPFGDVDQRLVNAEKSAHIVKRAKGASANAPQRETPEIYGDEYIAQLHSELRSVMRGGKTPPKRVAKSK